MSTPEMTAIAITTPGGPEVLQPIRCPIPTCSENDVLIAVEAAGVNRPDLLQRQGKYPPPPGASPLPGLEVAGRVAAVGLAVRRWRVGDKVCALVSGGGYAEYCVAPQQQCVQVPASFSMLEAAAIPEAFFTVWTNLFERGGLKAGESLLVHGGASGIGTTAIQLAHAFRSTVLATAGSPAKCAACVRLGAVRAIDYHHEDFVAAVREATRNRGVDVILDMVGGTYLQRNLDCLAIGGRLVQIAFMQGARVELDLGVLMRQRLTITGSTLRPRTPDEKGAIAEALEAQVWPLLSTRRIVPIIDRVFPLTEAAEAHRALEAGQHVGKMILRVGGQA